MSPRIVRIVKSRRKRWAGHGGSQGMHTKFLWEIVFENDYFQDLGGENKYQDV